MAAAGAAFALVGGGQQPARANPKLAALQRQAKLNRASAATWIAQQVGPGTAISCDSQMCDALKAAGYPVKYLQVLAPTSPPPATADLVIGTASVRRQFGSSLEATIAPAVIATIGSGQTAISIRMVAPDGLAAFQKALAAGQQARQQDEAPLVSEGITTSAAARADLTHGAVDMRLALAISSLAASRLPIDVVDFSNVGTGVSGDLPLRYADLVQPGRGTRMTSSAYMAALTAALRQIQGQYRPLWAKPVHLKSGAIVLRIDMSAPSPLGIPDDASTAG